MKSAKKVESRHFNSLGKITTTAVDAGCNPFSTDFELLRFYMGMISDGKLKVGSAGYMRMLQIKSRVEQHERDIQRGRNSQGVRLHNNKNSLLRKNVKAVLTELTQFDDKNRSKNQNS